MPFVLAEYLLLAVALTVSVPLVMLAVECLAALWPDRPSTESGAAPSHGPTVPPRIDVMIPAHDEAAGIAAAIESIRSELTAEDRIWVVADNCSDATATVARAHRARVIERDDSQRRGKSFALDFGVRQLALDPPDVLILMDADTRAMPGSLRRLAALASETGQPVQAANLMANRAQASPRELISQTAVLIKNFVRLVGLSRLGLACPLTGSGIALPWIIAKDVQWASGSIVEDMQMGLDLQLAGYRPRFCPQAQVDSWLPQQVAAAASQRRRWEHGHLHVILSQLPRLLAGAVRQRRAGLFGTALDMAVPPLSLLALLWAAALLVSIFAGALGGSWAALILLSSSGALAIGALLAACLRFSSREVVWKSVCSAPHYIVRKVPLYASFLFSRQRTWTRTARESLVDAQGPVLRIDP